MYLEISPRRSGKTTRMIKMMNECLKNDPISRIIVVSPNLSIAKYSIQMWTASHDIDYDKPEEVTKLLARFHNRVIAIAWGENALEKIERVNKGISHDTVFHCFYDEFDIINDLIPIRFDKYKVEEYFFTTPARIRTIEDIALNRLGLKRDLLLDLIKANGNRWQAYGPGGSISSIIDMYNKSSPEIIKMDVFGQWF